jgi:hypothetical protein
MPNQVEVLADDMGNVVRLSKNNPDYGYIKLGYNSITIGKGGWLKPRNLTSIILGNTEDLIMYSKTIGKSLPGKIVVKESLSPFNKKDPNRDLKYAGDTGVVCCVDGQPIYRKTEYVSDLSIEDTLINHDNGDDIRAANNLAADQINNTTAKDFGLKQEGFNNTTVDDIDDLNEESVEESVEEEAIEEVEDSYEQEEVFEL